MKINIKEKVYNYPTKYKEGFLASEISSLLKEFPDINKDFFDRALDGNTCMIKYGRIIHYHCDIEKALRCGIENRDLYHYEWD